MSADLLQRLIESGTPAALVAEVALEFGRAQVEREILAKRRQSERDRKARSRSVTGSHVTERDTADNPSLDKEIPPRPPKEINPIRGDIYPAREDAENLIVSEWNAMADRWKLPKISKLTPERKSRLKARLAEHGVDQFTEAIAAVARSPFCRGENDKGWRADFDFLLQPKSFTKLIEGSYDGTGRQQSTSRRGGGFAARLVNDGDISWPC